MDVGVFGRGGLDWRSSTAGAGTEVQKFGGFFFTKARLGCRGLTRVGPRSTLRFRRPGPGIVDPCRKGERGTRSRAVLQSRPSRFLLLLPQRVQGTVKRTKNRGENLTQEMQPETTTYA